MDKYTTLTAECPSGSMARDTIRRAFEKMGNDAMTRSDSQCGCADSSRYVRQILIPGFGSRAQQRLRSGHVFVAGLGGLGSPVAMYLACAGVGTLTLADCQHVEWSNLNRQILYQERDVGECKSLLAENRIALLNSSVEIRRIQARLTRQNVRELIGNADVVVDALDTLEAKLMLNQACVSQKVPLVHGAIHGTFGQVTTLIPGRTNCLACVLPKNSSPTAAIPVLGAVTGIVGSLQAMEAVKLLTGLGEPMTGRMLEIDAATGEFSTWRVVRNTYCRVCGEGA